MCVCVQKAWISARLVGKVHAGWLRRAVAADAAAGRGCEPTAGEGSADASLPRGMRSGTGGGMAAGDSATRSFRSQRSGPLSPTYSFTSGVRTEGSATSLAGYGSMRSIVSVHSDGGHAARHALRTHTEADVESEDSPSVNHHDGGPATTGKAADAAGNNRGPGRQAQQVVAPNRCTGRVVTWKAKGAYGFIRPDGSPSESLFVHVSTVAGPPRGRALAPGDVVEFTRGTNPQTGKPMAQRVVVLAARGAAPPFSGRGTGNSSRSLHSTHSAQGDQGRGAAHGRRHNAPPASPSSQGKGGPGNYRPYQGNTPPPGSQHPGRHGVAAAGQGRYAHGHAPRARGGSMDRGVVAAAYHAHGARAAAHQQAPQHHPAQQAPQYAGMPQQVYWGAGGADAGGMGLYATPRGVQQAMVVPPSHSLVYGHGYAAPPGVHFVVPHAAAWPAQAPQPQTPQPQPQTPHPQHAENPPTQQPAPPQQVPASQAPPQASSGAQST